MNFFGVMMHEICLSVMITSIKHPLVFMSLVLSDVLENSFCLWSLASNMKRSNRVAPEDFQTSIQQQQQQRKSLSRRPSNVVSLVQDKSNLSDDGTALFIAATLLQREMVETIVPIQAAGIISFLYILDVKSNSLVNGWTNTDLFQSMSYIGIDLAVEVAVFACTIFALRRIYPNFSAFRILMGLVRSNSETMLSNTIATWLTILIFQNTLSGFDLTLNFEWLNCDGENATWVGGFDWDNCH